MVPLSLIRKTLFVTCVFQVFHHSVYAQDRAWELMDELDVSPHAAPPLVRGSLHPVETFTPDASSPQFGDSSVAPLSYEAELLKSNMNLADVKNRLGEPDSVTSSSTKQGETWAYGRSLLFFQGEHLLGWSDAGDLGSRAVAHLATAPLKDRKAIFSEDGWKNAWERESTPKMGEIIDELIQSSDDDTKAGKSYSSPDSAGLSLSASSAAIDGSLSRKSSSN